MDSFCVEFDKQRNNILDTIVLLNKTNVTTKYEAQERGIQLSKNLYKLEQLYSEYFTKCSKK
jgi:hypothetical protein